MEKQTREVYLLYIGPILELGIHIYFLNPQVPPSSPQFPNYNMLW